TSSILHLPNDEMKGRIIGREGRNIRAIENLTGVDIIIDDTPETVIISCFDPVRREIAKTAIERLITDGRIQPSRIEEIVLKVKSEIDEIIMDAGEKARIEIKVPLLHQDVVKYQGRLKYRTSYGQNVLEHVKEVATLSGMIAAEIGEDIALAVRAGFLHDIGKAISVDGLGSHAEIGADFLKRVGEPERVVYAARHHHDKSESITDINCLIVMTADAISASRPGARDKALDSYVKRLTDLENIAMTYDGVDKAFAIQAGRELRVIVHNEMVSDDKARLLAKDIVEEIEESMVYPGQIKVAVIRESRAIEYAQ
ncbi:MAG: ribonuclease Y, partial [Spirochaetia bacterium]|nr:ribonuclease Y [Spirochaetia bacterium]